MTSGRGRLFTREFSLVIIGTYLCWFAFGATLPVLPRFVVDRLGAGEAAVGLVFGAYAAAAVLVRPLVGRVGDRRGRRRLIVVGALCAIAGMLGHLVVVSLPALVLVRLVAGAGHAAVVVGLSTLALDHSPPARHGESSSYLLVSVQIGIGTGPLLGALVLDRVSYDAVWLLVAAGSAACIAVTALLPKESVHPQVAARGLFHPAAWRPGVVMGVGILGFVGYLAFVPLYAPTIGIGQVAPLFLLASGGMALLRAVGARVPDRVGAVRTATLALSALVVAFLAMGSLPSAAGLYVTTLLMASGAALLAPSLVLAAVQGVAPGERARVVATITMFLDIASAAGPTVLGFVAARQGYGATFLVSGVAAGLALVLLRVWVAPSLATRASALGVVPRISDSVADVAPDGLGPDAPGSLAPGPATP